VITDRELDAQLAGAAGVPDAALPPLPEDFLAWLTAGPTVEEPASVTAARQLVADAHEARTALRRGPRRRTARARIGVAVVAVAAAWATAVLVAPSDRAGSPGGPPATEAVPTGSPSGAVDRLTLVAAEQATFPLSLEPPPAGLTPAFSFWGGVPYYGDQPPVHTADYLSPGGDRVLVSLFAEDPRSLDDHGVEGVPSGTVAVGGRSAEVWRSEFSVSLLWQRPDGRWVRITGEGAYADTAAVVGVAESVVDRPQPLGLQFGLAPAGWNLGGYEESRSLDLVSDAHPDQPPLRLSIFGGPGFPATIDVPFEGQALAGPVEPVTVQGLPGRIARADDGSSWLLAGQFADGTLFLLLAPAVLTREQVLEIAEQVMYSP
jgi:hypothetical protein